MNNQNYYPYQQPQMPMPEPSQPDPKSATAFSVAGLVCGIVGLVFLSFVVNIIGMVLSVKGKKLSKEVCGQPYAMAKTGFTLNLIGMIIWAAIVVLTCSAIVAIEVL